MKRRRDHSKRIGKRAVILILGLLSVELAGAQTEVGKPPPLKLPDVVIYGRDVLMLARSKGLEASYPAVPTALDAPAKLSKEDLARIGYEKATPRGDEVEWKNWLVEAHAGYGSFSSASFGLRQGLKIRDLHCLTSIDYDRSGDWVANSSHREGNFRGRLGYQLLDRLTTSARVGFREKEFGYYGSPSAARGEFRCFDANEELRYDVTQTLSVDASAVERWNKLVNPGSVWLYGGPNAIEVEPSIMLSWLSGQQAVAAKCQYLYERHFDSSENQPLDRNLITVTGGGDFHLSEDLSARMEVAYQHCRSDNSADSKERLYPRARIAYRFSDGLGIFAAYEPEIVPHGQSKLIGENSYFSGGWGPVEERWLDISVGMQAVYSTRVQGQVSVGVDRRRHAPHWWGSDGIFFVSASCELEVTRARLDLRYDVTDRLTLESTLSYEDIKNISPFYVGWGRFPYRPKERAEASIRYTPLEDLSVGMDLSYRGRRFTSGEEELEPFALIGVEVSKGLFEHFEVQGRMDNLLNTAYEIWQGYPMPGRSLTAGLNVKW